LPLLITFCANCAHVALTDQRELMNGHVPCADCSARVRVGPGCSFGESDRGLFGEISQSIAERTLSGTEAAAIASSIATARSPERNGALLERLTDRFPGLLPIQTAAGANQQAQQRALRMLRAIAEAIAFGKSVA